MGANLGQGLVPNTGYHFFLLNGDLTNIKTHSTIQKLFMKLFMKLSTTQVKQLPTTGLPLAAWVGAALLPVGLKLKRYTKSIFDRVEDGKYLFEEREFKKA